MRGGMPFSPLDAPDLGADPNPAAELPGPRDHGKQANGQAAPARPRAPFPNSARTALGVQLSASLRESLVEQLAAIDSADEAAAWAHRNLPAKNTLTAADAKIVEERFQARLSKISDGEEASGGTTPRSTPDHPGVHGPPPAVADHGVLAVGQPDSGAGHKASRRAKKQPRSDVVHALGKTVRLRDKEHRRFVLRQPCLVCGRVPSDPHHLTFTQPRALGRRVSDEFTVPVCRLHHRELHRSGNEAAWWQQFNIDPIPVALRLWQHTRSDDPTSPDARTAPKAPSQGEAPDRAPKAPG